MVETTGLTVGVIIAAVVIFLILVIFFGFSVFIVHQAEGIVIERLGRFHRVLNSGINFVSPFIDRPRQFTWRKTAIGPDGTITDETITSSRIDLRESVFNFLRQEVYTKDTVLLDVNALMYYRIFDIKKAIYEVDDLQGALSNAAQSQLKEVFGNMNFTEALTSQTSINDHLVKEFSKLFFAWGIHVERMELLDLAPKQATSEAMKKQMVAERTRRGDFIRSEGKKAAMRLTAEGSKMVSVNMGLAQQEATRKRSEGEAGSKVELARAESVALETVGNAIKSDGGSQTDYMIAEKYLELFRLAAQSVENKVIYLPYRISGLSGVVRRLPAVYGSKALSDRKVPTGKLIDVDDKKDQFADLN